MYVYAESIIIENLIINYMILYTTNMLTKTYTSKKRVLLASLIGAIYTLLIFFPHIKTIIKITTKVAVLVIIIMVAFEPKSLRDFIKLMATFHVVAFAFAGSCLALFYAAGIETYVNEGVFYISNFKIKTLATGIIIGIILLQVSIEYMKSKQIKDRSLIPITISFRNDKVKVQALLDTGNSLKDPVTKAPVVVVQFSVVKDMFPENIQDLFCKYSNDTTSLITNIMNNHHNNFKFNLIPFKSLGEENGMLLGFKPDEILVDINGDKEVKDAIIGIYTNKLSSENSYEALLHPETLD